MCIYRLFIGRGCLNACCWGRCERSIYMISASRWCAACVAGRWSGYGCPFHFLSLSTWAIVFLLSLFVACVNDLWLTFLWCTQSKAIECCIYCWLIQKNETTHFLYILCSQCSLPPNSCNSLSFPSPKWCLTFTNGFNGLIPHWWLINGKVITFLSI